MTPDRSGFDEAVANLFSNPKYAPNYLFYGHMVGQCRVVFDTTMKAPAGVNFMHDHFNLYINPEDTWVEADPATLASAKHKPQTRKTPEGKTEICLKGFNSYTLEQRLGILKHEMLHILYNHMRRKGDRDHRSFNIAADCAINQLIDRNHLPAEGIFPDQFPSATGKVPLNLTAEQYYELIDKQYNDDSNGPGSGSGQCIDDHSKWDESQGDGALSEDIAKNMADRAVSQTQKSRGNIPSELSEWLSLLSHKREVTWQQHLRYITGNKRVGIRKTILRPDRRLPNAEWIKGRTKDRRYSVLVISDVSGSVSNESLLSLWSEVRNICELTQSSIDLIQVDTQPSKPEKLTKNTKTIQRKACGGTYLSPALEMARKHKLDFQAIVVTTDGYLDESDVVAFDKLHIPVIWLIEADGRVMPSMISSHMKAFQLKN